LGEVKKKKFIERKEFGGESGEGKGDVGMVEVEDFGEKKAGRMAQVKDKKREKSEDSAGGESEEEI